MCSWSKSPARTSLVLLFTVALLGSGCSSADGGSEGGGPSDEDAGDVVDPKPDSGRADASRPTADGSAARDASSSPPRDAGAADRQDAEAGATAPDGGRDAAPDTALPSSDGGAPDASERSGCSGTTLFCEDFEAVALGDAAANARWEPSGVNATLTVEEGRARGQRALHVRAMGNGRGLLHVKNFAAPSNSFFGRMHVFAAALPSAPNYAHYTLFEAAGAQPGLIRPIGGQYIQGMGNLLGPGSDGGPTGDWTNWKPSAPFAAGKWVCFEWELRAADNEIKVWIDGVAKPDLTVSTKVHGGTQADFVFPTIDRVWFGWWLYQGGPTPNQFDLWFDDLALASTRLGC